MAGQFTSAGLNAIAVGGLTSTQFPFAGVGTGSATFALGLAAMGTETYRQAIDSATAAGGMTRIVNYLSNSEGIATLTETGLWTLVSGGTLLSYNAFVSSIVKSGSKSLVSDTVLVVKNAESLAALTGEGIRRLRAGGFTNTQFPYIAAGSGTATFNKTMTAMGTELAREATTWSISGAVATVKGTFAAGTGTGTWSEFGLWSASSGGTLLGYMLLDTPYVKAAGVGRKAVMAFTLANEA